MIIDDIALTMHPEVGPKTAIHLMECFGGAGNIFAATQEQLIEVAQLKPAIAKSITNKEYHKRAEQELTFITQNRITAICSDSPQYPARVKESCDYPHIIYVKGNIDFNSGHWLSIVGTRKITSYGLRMCEQLVGELADLFPDLVIVSGLAYGVDIAAHRAALNSNILTIGVLGHALTHIYPPQHTDVARRVVDSGGALISEFHSGAKPDKSGFVQRNRIIAALSEGTLIVESASRGGSLITAEMADGYNRQVMAIPGRLGDPYSEGTNALIKNLKAEMVTSCKDIVTIMDWDIPSTITTTTPQQAHLWPESELQIEQSTGQSTQFKYSWQSEQPSTPIIQTENMGSVARMTQNAGQIKVDTYQGTTTPSGRILEMIGSETPTSFDELTINSGLKTPVLSALLLDLEFSGKIRTLPGKQYIRK